MANTTYAPSLNISDSNVHSGNIISSFNKTTYISDEDAHIMQWLSPLEPQNRHQGVSTDRLDGVGSWLLETNEFRRWRDGEGGVDEAVVFCSGDPGVGKTYLSSLVIDSLCDGAGNKDIAVVGFYCDFLAQGEQTITNVMGAILKQLVGRGDIPNYVREAFQKAKREFGGRRPRLPDLVGMLKTTIATLSQVFICIDALDEYLPKNLPELLKSLRDIIRESPRTRIFLTGRPHVGADVQRVFTKAAVIPISPNTGDIRRYLETKLDNDTEPDAMNDDLRADILRIIPERISQIFLLVSLNIDAILGEVTLRQRKRKLDEMAQGSGLSDAYTATLGRLKAQKGNKSELGLKVLMWVSHSERPLHAAELCHALGVEIGSPDIDFENVPTLRTLLACTLGLVTVEASSSTLRLLHYTLQEHLSNNLILFNNPHSTIAEVCLTYLDFRCIRDLSPTHFRAPPTVPFLEYASHFWETHARKEMTEGVKALTLRLLDGFDRHISAQLVLLHYENHRRLHEPQYPKVGGPKGFTGLHGAAFFGNTAILAAVLEIKTWDVNETDCAGSTALTWAAGRGHEAVVKLLLEQEDLDPNKPDTLSGQTPLTWAAVNGHEGVVRILLERDDINPNTSDDKGQTPLLWAAENGHEGMVKMLLEREDVDVNAPDTKYGQTPLSWAAMKGREGMVKMLLERADVDVNALYTEYGQTPLSWAAMNGHEGVVKMLLEGDDVDVNMPDAEYGQTPLLWAAENGHEGVVEMLLEREDVDVNMSDTEYGQPPLSWAAENGHEGAVKMLLEREDVDVNAPHTEYGQTSLLWAAKNGHEGIVKMLLERKNVDVNAPDTECGRTPLSWAAKNGHGGVVQMLLNRDNVNPDTLDDYGGTPLFWAARNGHEEAVKMLLEREDVDVNASYTEYGQTPLFWAAKNGHEGVVKMLLERDDTNPNIPDDKGQTALLWAVMNGHEGMIKVLLEREDVDVNAIYTKYGQTPLSWAAMNEHEGVVKMFLEREDVAVNGLYTEDDQTPLLWAAMKGHEGIVKMLLEREDVDVNALYTKYDQTPLSWAAVMGHEGVVKMLLEREDVDVNTLYIEYGQTPLSWAAMMGHEGVVKMLLEREDVDVNALYTEYSETPLSSSRVVTKEHEGMIKMILEREDVDVNALYTQYGQTPLSWAAMNGHEGVVKMLLEREDVGVNTPGTGYGRRLLSWAAEKGHEGVVKMLLERDDINPNTLDDKGLTALLWAAGKEDVDVNMADTEYCQTLLLWAAENGHEEVVKMLLERDDINPNTPDDKGQTPLSLAFSGGHYAIVSLLHTRRRKATQSQKIALAKPYPSRP